MRKGPSHALLLLLVVPALELSFPHRVLLDRQAVQLYRMKKHNSAGGAYVSSEAVADNDHPDDLPPRAHRDERPVDVEAELHERGSSMSQAT